MVPAVTAAGYTVAPTEATFPAGAPRIRIDFVAVSGLDVAAQDALTLPERFFKAPPIVCYLHRGLGG